MKILIVTAEIGLDGGGMSLSCSRLQRLLSLKHEVSIVNSAESPIITSAGGKFPEIGVNIRKEYKLKTDIQKYTDYDIVIAFGGAYNGYYASLLAERLFLPLFLCLRGSDINLAKWSIDNAWYLQESCRKAVKIICLTQEMVLNLLSLIPGIDSKIFTVPNEIDPKVDKLKYSFSSSSVTIGCAAAHMNEKKGITNLFSMVSLFKREYGIPIRFELIGDIDPDLKKNYEDYIKQYDIREEVVFKSRQNRKKLSAAMNTWDYYIQGSVAEGHPNSIVEALNSGCGFISSPTGYLYEELKNDFAKLFFRSWDPQSMAEDLYNLIQIKNKSEIFNSVRTRLNQLCNMETISSQWESILHFEQDRPREINVEHVIAVALHDVQGELHDSITTPSSVFEKFAGYIYSQGYRLCSMKDYIASSEECRKSCIVLTFDDGYENLVKIVAPILLKYSFTATVFICTGLIGKDNGWNNKDAKSRQHLDINEIKTLLAQGWEIGSHGVYHKNLLKLTDQEIEQELSESKEYIGKIAGYVESYAYPYGAYNAFIKSCVKKYYKYAFAVSQGGTSLVADSMQIKRYSITEIYQMLKLK